jgi:AAA+ superfamily predicted ATPase
MRLDVALLVPFADAIDQIGEELRCLDRLLARHVARLRRDGKFNEDPLRGLYIGDDEALAALGRTTPAPEDDAEIALGRAVLDAREQRSADLPLAAIARRFGLDRFERTALLIAAAPSLDRRYQTLYAYAQNDVARRLPAIDLVLALLVDDPADRLRHLARFAADAPLRRGGLVRWSDADQDKPLADRALAVDDRVVMALLGAASTADDRLAGFVRAVDGVARSTDDDLTAQCRAASSRGAEMIVFEGPLDTGQAQAAAAVCRSCGEALIEADLDHPAARVLPSGLLGRLLAREALLSDSGLLISASHGWPDHGVEHLLLAAAKLQPRLFVSARHGALDLPLLAREIRLACIEPLPADAPTRAEWWRAALPASARTSVERLAKSTRIGPRAIARTVATTETHDEPALLAAVGIHAGGQLPSIAQRVRAHWSWDDLVLAERPRAQLAELAATLVHWPRVTGDWGFAAKLPVAQNCVALFSGPSGTGKTMAASLVAREAAMPLYRVDLSAIFDKYIGETEKHLDRLFDAAAEASAVLLFDEADALFGKRTALKDAHDRYANLSVAYLLQRIETYDGLAILATNLPGNMDQAFARRLAHVIAFPLPDEAERRALWARAFPAQAPLAADIGLDAIAATFEISGGNIRNAALAAAYLAASDGGVIEQSHVLRALARELEKIGRTPIAADYGALGPGG